LRVSSRLYNISFKKRIPVDAIIELTSRCNLNCRHCYFGKFLNRGRDLKFEVLKRVLKDLKKAGTLFLTFTGGEPLLYRDFFKLSHFAKRLNFDLRVFTNGTLIGKYEAEKIRKTGFSSVEISLYGGKEKTHEFFTKIRGSFKKTLKGIEYLKEQGVPVWIKVLVMKKNLNEVNEIKSIAKYFGVKVRFDPLVSAGYGFNKEPLKYRLDKGSIIKFILDKKIKKIKDYPVCGAGKNIVAIGFNGEVYPCLLLPLSFGNIRKRSFLDIWKDMEAFKFDYCKKCKLKEKCFYCPGIVFFEKGKIGTKFDIFCEITKNTALVTK